MGKIAAAQSGRSREQDRSADGSAGSTGAGRGFRADSALRPLRKVQLGSGRAREDKMTSRKSARTFAVFVVTFVVAFVGSSALRAQRDPAEPPQANPAPKLLPRPPATISRPDVDEAGMR